MRILTQSLANTTIVLLFALMYPALARSAQPGKDAAWDAVDGHVKQNVYQLNVALKVSVKNGFAQLADLSPRKHYPVFTTVKADQGFRVMGHGSCFPVRTLRQDKTFLLTNKHVVDFGEGMLQECERFFAGMRLYAERSAGFTNPDQRYKDLERIVSFAGKKGISETERTMYQATVDTIWDTYDNHLSNAADPQRKEFTRCLEKTGLHGEAGYFVHTPGPFSQPPVVAQLYKQAHRENEPDLALLIIKKTAAGLDLDPQPAVVGQPIQAVGYPAAGKPVKGAAPYAPNFSTGKVTRVQPMIVHFDANVSKGDSGGPLISQRGKVLGVVARRAMPDVSTDRFAGAISVTAVKAFAPELFGKPGR